MYLFNLFSNKFEFVSAASSYWSGSASDGWLCFSEQPRAGGCGADKAIASVRSPRNGRTDRRNGMKQTDFEIEEMIEECIDVSKYAMKQKISEQ